MKQILIVLLSFTLLAFGLSEKIQKKVDKQIKETFDVETFTFSAKLISEDLAKTLPSTFGADNFFEIKTNNKLLGYAYVAKAPSKTAKFDYLVLLDADLIVKSAKVLIYREEYGGEIGSKRWLKQFVGKTKNDQLKYGDNIVAISGATISVRSMTNAMNDLLASLKILNQKGAL
ncbi:FMN-binding protein [Olleya aquimaris]|uniref:Na+-translocating ferredoxin:NAD+ oxidoreductase RnfG subunit n=1 Tax=Olleya aquimaris TaxID=639310 RepID=A0A327R9W6_9FLAO|nr:FMN-binding protein [Olleya aquimaris]RAJ12958.1 Na+-translocating ferredoxin:NAD+ oxidoreductase RnfG subunit [Olleya aquimaris]